MAAIKLKCLNLNDTVSKLEFDSNDKLLCSSWDGSVSCVNWKEDELEWSLGIDHLNDEADPVLDLCALKEGYILGTLNGKVLHLQKGESSVVYRPIGEHCGGICRVKEAQAIGWILSAGWDRTLRIWDLRDSSKSHEKKRVELPKKAFTMDILGNKVVVGMSNRLVYVYDIRNFSKVWQKRASSLKHMTRDITCMNSGEGYVSCSIEGRIAVEYFDPSAKMQERKYAFKCHRKKVDGVDTIYPVNCVLYHPKHDTFASAGADGTVNMWDPQAKKRIKQFQISESSGISAIAFNSQGNLLAAATGYTYENGDLNSQSESNVYIKQLSSSEYLPRQ